MELEKADILTRAVGAEWTPDIRKPVRNIATALSLGQCSQCPQVLAIRKGKSD